MASTPIYNWPTPDNTGLVKNGALDMRTLGNAIDTTMATMTPKSLVDAKGDLIAATANDTPARLAVGNNGETLVADSSTSTGLRWTGTPSASNPVLNSAMQIWQRGTSVSIPASTGAAAGYSADRWDTVTGTNQACTVSRQATNDTTNLPNIQYAMRFQRNSGQTGTGGINLAQNFETANSVPFAGKTVTMSFYLRVGANWSGGALTVILYTGTSTDANVLLGGFTSAATPINTTATPTTTWQRFSFTGTISSTATQLAPLFGFYPTGTAGAADYYELTGVQIDVGSVALPFRTNAGTIQGETDACQRYLPAVLVSTGDVGTGQAYSSTAALVTIPFPTTARVAPTGVTVNAAGNFRLRNSTAGLVSPTAIVFGTSTPNSGTVEITGASGLSAGNATSLVNFASGTILFTGCEL